MLEHHDFNIKNPNRVRALIGAFTQTNPRNFHALDGSGYAFLRRMIEKVDQINPQIAARLATPFTRWQNLDLPRQELIRQELHLLASKDLSRDLFELVQKGLDG